MDEQKIVRDLRKIVYDLDRVESRLRRGDTGNLTYRHSFSALASARRLLRELDPEEGGESPSQAGQ